MEHVGTGPQRATASSGAQNNAGWRKASAGLINATRLADEGAAQEVTKTRAVVAAKRVGAHIGLKAADLLLLDTLAAFTQPQDWTEGQRPIVWASNAYLMDQTGFSLSTLKRHARRLAETRMISFEDSPNGKRWGRRDAEGFIVEAYGFDLSPLAAQVETFEAIAAELAAERALCQRLKRKITVLRRSIRARLVAAQEARQQGRGWISLQKSFEALLSRLPGARVGSDALMAMASALSELLQQVEALVFDKSEPVPHSISPQQNSTKMNPREAISEPHILITSELHSVNSNSLENKEGETDAPRPAKVAHDAPAGEISNAKVMLGVELPVLLQACPEFASWAHNMGGYLRDWSDFVRVAGELRPMIGVSDHAWTTAQQQMGKIQAAAALALVFEKVHSGEVNSPGGYLRGMVAKAEAGELHLERSFFGRLNGIAA
ncbi:plasmid replication protein RepC [Cognatiyoonia sp. IB215446]|uniref:plasmid replication protein RepC n=1 Tax=Cognatiyoonia sp. IB215446 TaxID=3097355 RepID=UPI002A1561DF|nr:plasmid replication protein RepC [Cognatiyoonia sp. IB215446]MDX8350412.1 plasmid replication protein RepC [Cognatiyoonia sp. IB215446]